MKLGSFLFFLWIVAIPSFAQSSLSKLASKAEFIRFSGPPLSDKYGQVTAVKVVYDLQTETLYFVNAKHFKYHYEFCNKQLFYSADLNHFNATNYSQDPNRRFLLANINYFTTLGIYALEISEVDLMSKTHIQFLYKKVAVTTFIGNRLQLLMNNARLMNEKKFFQSYFPTLDPTKVYGNLSYQAISKHNSYGILRFIDNLELEKNSLQPIDIIVLKETPAYLPKVAGIIVTEFQTPLSHLTILGQNRKIPIAAYKSAFQDSLLRRLANKKVVFAVLGDTFKIKRADFTPSTSQPAKAIKLEYDLRVDTLIDIKKMTAKSYKYAGNKACNFGLLYKISQKSTFKTPESAFAIPFYFYQAHVTKGKAIGKINLLLSKATQPKDSLPLYLKAIRDEIENAPLDSNLLRLIEQKIKSLGTYTRMRFRSSTNAEDAKGFSGAGLYASKTGDLNSEKKPIDKAVKEVWASLWSEEAYSERELYGINHREAFMGILVHRSFPEEAVNGVAITKNLYQKNIGGFVVNAQVGDKSVVQPESGIVCDQFICYPDNLDVLFTNKQSVEIITLSNLNKNKLVMTTTEIQHLANQLEIIKRYFMRHTATTKSYWDFGLDIEFKLQGEKRELYIKQVRLYND